MKKYLVLVDKETKVEIFAINSNDARWVAKKKYNAFEVLVLKRIS
jgi:hypothetical protein